jgi:hypothetical protein
MKRILLILCSISLAVQATWAADVTATLEPSQVSVGEPAQLTITVNGSSSAEPSIPDIPGLEIAHVGQSTQVQVINGSMTVSSVQTYEVTPSRAGTFTIPAIQAAGAKSRPLTLRVTGSGGAGGNAQSGGSQNSSGSAPSQPNAQTQQPDNAAPGNSRYGFIQVAVPKKEVYVGELVPVDIEVFVPAGLQAQLEGLPALDSQTFTLNPLGEKPEQRVRLIEGHQYTELTWHSAVTAVKPGDFSLTMQMPLSVIVREQPRRPQHSGNDLFDQFFNDPFFNDPFMGRAVKKDVNIASEPEDLTVKPLPAAGRPADFSGAVGNFDIQASASPTNVTAGDPITLRLELRGTGDFDRATSGMLAAENSWKTYPPKGTFHPENGASYRGTKTLEQLVIPQDPDVKEIPALRFSFFDPKKGQYETRTTPPIPVSVKPAPASFTVSATPAAAGASPTATPPPDLVPNKVEPGRFAATLRPVFLNPWFVAAQGLPLCGLAAGLVFIRRKRRFDADPRFARASAATREIHAQLDRMDRAMREHASEEFFLAARSALQHRLGERWNLRPETITLAEIRSRLNGAGEGIRPVFEMADQISYSGQNLGDADYHRWKDLVVEQLKQLEKTT